MTLLRMRGLSPGLALCTLGLIDTCSGQGIPNGGGGGGGGRGGGGRRRDDDRDRCQVWHCHRCSMMSHLCASCDSGYTLMDGGWRCAPCAYHCSQCDRVGPESCDPGQCWTGYFNDVHECMPCSRGCTRCTSTLPESCKACAWWRFYSMQPAGAGCAFGWAAFGTAAAIVLTACGFFYLSVNGRPAGATSAVEHARYVGAPAGRKQQLYPSGAWRGYYSHVDGQHGVCEFRLAFDSSGIRGDGTDDVGGYSIRGLAGSNGHVAFTKQYLAGTLSAGGLVRAENQAHAVEYRGKAARTDANGRPVLGNGVRGKWSIRRHGWLPVTMYSGVFHLWPVMRHWEVDGDEADGAAEESECCVCYDRQIDVRLEPCGHVALCGACAAQLRPQRCPLCRVDIRQVQSVRV